MLKAKSYVLLVCLGVAVVLLVLTPNYTQAQTQTIRELNKPSLVREPLTDDHEAVRMFYLSLGTLSTTDRNNRLKQIGLNDSEIIAASAAVSSFKSSHDADSSSFMAQALNSRNTSDDLSAYQGKIDGVLQELQNKLSSQLSSASVKAVANAIEGAKSTMSVYRFTFEVPSEVPASAFQQHAPRLQTASYHPNPKPIICPTPYAHSPTFILLVTGTVSGSASMTTSDGVHFSMPMTASGTYSASYSTSYTCDF